MSAITHQTILAELNMSVWTGSKQDRTATDEVIVAKNAGNSKAAKVTKNLLADSEKLKGVQGIAAAARLWFYKRTLPWGNSGTRLLPTKEFFDFRRELGEYEQKFNDAVQDFLDEYPTIVQNAAVALGDLFDLSEYPTPKNAARKFAFKYSFSPVPEAGDFRIEMSNEEVDFLKQEYEKEAAARVKSAMDDAWERVHKTCKHLSERLASDTDGKRKIIRDSVISNAKELLDVLGSLNITDDPKLREAEHELHNALFAVDGNDVRKSEAVREAVKERVDTLLDKLGAWGLAKKANRNFMTIRLREVDDGRWEVALNYVVRARVGASWGTPTVRKRLPDIVYKQIALLRMIEPYKYVKNVGFRDHAGYFYIDTPVEENFK